MAAGGQPDFKECYFAAPEPGDPEAASLHPQIYAENLWPEGIPASPRPTSRWGARCSRGGRAAARVRGGARARRQRVRRRGEGRAHVTRALRYLPLDAAQTDAGILWGEEHTDFNLLTLLPGGRFLDPAGVRCPPPDPGAGSTSERARRPTSPAGR
ncbi:MAG: hypothetical protein U0325_18470 [Polyangiales bacterium]